MCHLSPASRTAGGTKQTRNAFLKESDVDWNGSGATAEGFLCEFRLASYIADAMVFANTPRKEKEMLMFPFSPEIGPGPKSIAFAFWTPGLRVIFKLREEQDWRVAGSTLFWKATSAERQPHDLMDSFSFQIVNVFIRRGQLRKLLAENFPFNLLSPYSLLLLTFWSKQKVLWKNWDYFCCKFPVFHGMTECPRVETSRS